MIALLRRLCVPCVVPMAVMGWAALARAETLLPFTAVLNGAQETPPVQSPSQGVALVTYNVEQGLLCYALSYSALSSPELVAHFHGPGAPTVSAPIVFAITPTPSPVGSPKSGCVGPLGKADVKNLRRVLFYLNVHTVSFPSGEIRGQVLPEKPRYKGVPATSSSTTSSTTTTSSTSTTTASPSGAFLAEDPGR